MLELLILFKFQAEETEELEVMHDMEIILLETLEVAVMEQAQLM